MILRRLSHHTLILWSCLVACGVLRAWFAMRCELSPDEAYYWVWSTKLASGYYDHGPAVAWLIRLGTEVFGNTEWGVRSGALICSLICIWLVYLVAKEVVSKTSHALWAAILANLTPLFSAGAVIHTPDAILTTAWAGAVWCGLRAYRSQSSLSWIGMGVCIGLALLAKMTAVLLLFGLAVFLVSCTMARQTLKSTGPVLAVMAAALVALPNLIWNLEHAGGSFAFQFRHGTSGPELSGVHFASFLGGQIGVVSPLLWIGLIAFMAVGWRRMIRYARSDIYFLWCLSAPGMLLFAVIAAVHKVEANWPAVAYLSAIPAAAWSWTGGQWYLKRFKIWVGVAVGLALLMSAAIHLQALRPFLPIESSRDPTARLRGWKQLSEQAREEARIYSAMLVGEGYGPVSLLRFYTEEKVLYEPSSSRMSQYDVWASEPCAQTILFLQPKSSSKMARCCRDVQERWLLPKEPQSKGEYSIRALDYLWWICKPRQPSGQGLD